MQILERILMMTVTLSARILFGLVLYIFLARELGPIGVGQFFFFLSVMNVVIILVDFGFAQSLLRDIGADSQKANDIVNAAIFVKLIITMLVLLGAGVYCLIFQAPFFAYVLLIAAIINSFTEMFGCILRALNRYKEEVWITSVGNMLAVVSIVLTVEAGEHAPIITASIIATYRALAFLFMFVVMYKILPNLRVERLSRAVFFSVLKNGWPYATDAAVSTLNSNLDVVLVRAFLGDISVAIYQAGQRIVIGLSTLAQVISNVYLPILARDKSNRKTTVMYIFVLTGSVSFAVLTGLSEKLVYGLFGDKFLALVNALPYFGVLVFFRFMAAYGGLLLTAKGCQKIRIRANLISLCVSFLFFLAIKSFADFESMVIAQISGVICMGSMYYFALMNAKGE